MFMFRYHGHALASASPPCLVRFLILKCIREREVIRERRNLTNPRAFYNKVVASVEKGRITNIVYLHFCKFFYMVPDSIPAAKLERKGFEGWTFK